VLQEREVTPLGETRAVPTDVRVIAAAHRSLRSLVETGAFREDLLARISGYQHELPALRDRLDDLGLLLRALLPRHARERAPAISLSADAAYALLGHTWPLNVRELEQRLRTAVALAEEGRIQLSHLWKEGAPLSDPPKAKGTADLLRSREDDALHAELVERLTAFRGNVTHVGQAMGKSRTQIQRWLRRLGIDATRFRS
jgi:transcriptional regulator of acetoin/glycerol metabolism